MRIIIVGAGQVGTQLAKHLIEAKHDISLIEANEERARHVSNRLDCRVIPDQGNSISALEDAGIAKADALVCVTEDDEVNMIICGLASRYETPAHRLVKIARVRKDEYVRRNFQSQIDSHSGGALGIDYFIHPDVEAARSTLDAIEHGASGDILSFAGTPFELAAIDIEAGSGFDGIELVKFRAVLPGDSLVTMVERLKEGGSGSETIIPKGDTKLSAGDRIYLLAKEGVLDEAFRLAGRSDKPLRKIGIVGGGRLGSLIAEGLFRNEGEGRRKGIFSIFKKIIPHSFRSITLIEQDYLLCKDLAARFPDALVLNEDISDESFVSEERLDGLDLIVTATEQPELTVITAVYLKSRGVRRAIAMVTGSGYVAIARRLGVDVVIPMKSVVVDAILSKLFGGGLKAIHRIGDGSTGILEVEISAGCPAEGKALKDFHLPQGALVMMVDPGTPMKAEDDASGDDDFIPRGDYVYAAGHRLLIISKNGTEGEIQNQFGAKQAEG